MRRYPPGAHHRRAVPPECGQPVVLRPVVGHEEAVGRFLRGPDPGPHVRLDRRGGDGELAPAARLVREAQPVRFLVFGAHQDGLVAERPADPLRVLRVAHQLGTPVRVVQLQQVLQAPQRRPGHGEAPATGRLLPREVEPVPGHGRVLDQPYAGELPLGVAEPEGQRVGAAPHARPARPGRPRPCAPRWPPRRSVRPRAAGRPVPSRRPGPDRPAPP